MSKVTNRRRVTLPKALADAYGIQPGDEIRWEPAGEAIRVVPVGRGAPRLTAQERLALFDEATRRHDERWEGRALPRTPPTDGHWRRDQLYDRGPAG